MYKQNEMDNFDSSIEALFKAFKQPGTTQDQLELLIKEALNQGADINVQENSILGFTPLIFAIKEEYYDVIKLLLERGANPNMLDKFDNSPLDQTILNTFNLEKQVDIAKLLLQNGALIEPKDSAKWTSIQIAVHKKNTEIVKLLIQYGANLNPTPPSSGFYKDTNLIELAEGNKPLQSFLKLAIACKDNNFAMIDNSITINDINEFLDWKISITPEESRFLSKNLKELYYLKNFLFTKTEFHKNEFIEKINDTVNLHTTLKNSLMFKIVENPELYKPDILSEDIIDQLKDYELKLIGI